MKFEDIRTTKPSLGQNASRGVFRNLLQLPWWMYRSDVSNDVPRLADRFMRIHGIVPGILGPRISPFCIDVFYYQRADGTEVKGAWYLNGAAFYIAPLDALETTYLCVDPKTAEAWGYPDDYISMSGESLSEDHKDED